MRRREVLKLAGVAMLRTAFPRSAYEQQRPARGWSSSFGATSLTLGPPGKENALMLTRFLRAGGFAEVTPTLASLWWDDENLYVEFVNTEPDPLYRGNPCLAKTNKYPGTGRFDLESWPDAVYVQYRPGWGVDDAAQVFAVDSSGAQAGSGHPATVLRDATGWTARFTLPWKLLNGRPSSHGFGLSVVRSRGQSSEVLSPIALDQSLKLNEDLLMFAQFGDRAACRTADNILCTLPDGTRRWQLPAQLVSPTEDECRALWRQQQMLANPTRSVMLDERIGLAERLHELLVLEGFSFHTDGANWLVQPGEFYPHDARIAVNNALCQRDSAQACAVLDVYLGQLDRAVRRWFADGSPGNVRTESWFEVTNVEPAQPVGNELHLPVKAGNRSFSLWISHASGALRICGNRDGYFRPSQSELPSDSGDLRVRIESNPWKIVALDAQGVEHWNLRQGQLRLLLSDADDVLAIDLRSPLHEREDLYGFGERFNSLGQRNRIVTLWDTDCWDGLVHGQLNQAYKNVPLMHSTAGYSLFWNSSYRLRADVGCTHENELRLTMAGDVLDLFVWPISPAKAMAGYTELTGTPMTPPQWAFEPWMGGGGRRWANGPLKNVVKEELHVVEQFRSLDIPHAAIYAESGNGDPNLYAGLEGDHLHVLAWVNASMKMERMRELLPGIPDGELPALRLRNGSIARRHDDGEAIIDYTHPQATELLRRFWAPRLKLGVAGSMVDFGDVVPDDAVFHNGKTGVEMHNFYAHSYHRAYHDVFCAAHGEDYILFARSACAGDQSSICYCSGDHQANFFGMRGALRGGLNAAACGLSTWGADAGGYFGWPDPEVYIRWTEWGAFCPLMRFHGTTPREPWEYGKEAVTIYRKYAWLRESFLPYIIRTADQANATGVSILRPMAFAYPNALSLTACDDQYMFGDDLLIAPMLRSGDRRRVILPPGRWTDFWTGTEFHGNRTIDLALPLDRIGVLLREGAAVQLDLPHSLTPGDGMSAGKLRAVLTTKPAKGQQWSVDARGAQVLLRYEHGRRHVVQLHGEPAWTATTDEQQSNISK